MDDAAKKELGKETAFAWGVAFANIELELLLNSFAFLRVRLPAWILENLAPKAKKLAEFAAEHPKQILGFAVDSLKELGTDAIEKGIAKNDNQR